jgi:peptide/nickel transport system permease protein
LISWQLLRGKPGLLAGSIIVATVSLVAVTSIEWGDPPGSLLARAGLTHPPQKMYRELKPLAPPAPGHVMGLDHLGRDIFSRLVHGARVSFFVGISAEAVALTLGLLVGTIAGYAGGRLDALLMRATDLLMALPLPITAMGVIALLPTKNIILVFMVLGLLGWGGLARLVRAEIISLKEREFSDAARALGAGGGRIAFLHLLPHAATPALVMATVGVAGNILTESWLSFLGLGVELGTPSWGAMIYEARGYLAESPYYCLFPGIALAVTVGGFILLADGMRAMLDPKQRERVGTL